MIPFGYRAFAPFILSRFKDEGQGHGILTGQAFRQVIAAPAPHRADPQIRQGRQLRNGGDFRMGSSTNLAQGQPVGRGPSADQGQRPPPGFPVATAAQSIAVNGGSFSMDQPGLPTGPIWKTDRNCSGSSRLKTRPKVSRGSIRLGRRKKGNNQPTFGWVELGNFHPIVPSANHRAERQGHAGQQIMPLGPSILDNAP